MNKGIKKIQEILISEIENLSEKQVDKLEISKANAISNNAITYIKSINLQIRLAELKEKNKKIVDELQ